MKKSPFVVALSVVVAANVLLGSFSAYSDGASLAYSPIGDPRARPSLAIAGCVEDPDAHPTALSPNRRTNPYAEVLNASISFPWSSAKLAYDSMSWERRWERCREQAKEVISASR